MLFEQSEDHKPVMWLRGYPVYSTHVIVGIYVISMLITTIAGPEGMSAMVAYMSFSSELVLHGQVWRALTYGLVNPPSLGFAIDMVLLVWFGRELERFFGRKIFLRFYGTIYLLSPLVYTLLGFFRPTAFFGETGGLAVFVAFATLYPGACILFFLTAQWVAIILVGVYTVMALYARDMIGLVALWVSVAFAYAFVQYERGRLHFPRIRLPSFKSRPKLRVLPNPASHPEQEDVDEQDASMTEIDALLDKIAKSGIASLTPKERKRLEKAREDLMKRETPRH
jgi:Rhomboid family